MVQSNDHDPVATPGKAVPDAIGQRGDKNKSASDATDTTTPGEAFGKAQHPEAEEADTSTSPKVPGKSVPDAIEGLGRP